MPSFYRLPELSRQSDRSRRSQLCSRTIVSDLLVLVAFWADKFTELRLELFEIGRNLRNVLFRTLLLVRGVCGVSFLFHRLDFTRIAWSYGDRTTAA
jgi:hypothetical protein